MLWRELNDIKQHWSFIQEQSQQWGAFLQTPAWAQFLQRQGNTTKALGCYEQDKLVGIAQLTRINLPGNLSYWFAPKGPIFTVSKKIDNKKRYIEELIEFLQEKKLVFVRLESTEKVGGAQHTKDVNPRATTIVDLVGNYEKVLAAMHEKTRYNIRLAERKGLSFRWGNAEDFKNFWDLLQATAVREKFRTHTVGHYRSLLELFGTVPITTKELACRLGLVEYDGQVLAANLIVIANGFATYLHGASSREHREYMAPYLLHGSIIQDLIKAQVKTYDLWGIEPEAGGLPNWSGFTRFKLGFGGQRYESVGTFDYPNRKLLYYLYRLGRRVR